MALDLFMNLSGFHKQNLRTDNVKYNLVRFCLSMIAASATVQNEHLSSNMNSTLVRFVAN